LERIASDNEQVFIEPNQMLIGDEESVASTVIIVFEPVDYSRGAVFDRRQMEVDGVGCESA